MKKIIIVGLGLIGGSLAAALRGFEDYTVVGVNRSRAALDFAQAHGMADAFSDDFLASVREGDVVFCCLPPKATLNFLETYQTEFKPGALVTDVCGVKTAVMRAACCLPDSVDFIGSHPMAGKEKGGIENADKRLFYNAHYIITPRPGSGEEHIAFFERMAKYIGCRDLVNTTPEQHDAIIAYTSQAMHVMAVSICDDPDMFDCLGFEGGSFRDCTRVAALDVSLWTELFSMNREALTAVLQRLEDNLRAYRETIESGTEERLSEKLRYSSERKRRMNIEHARGDDKRPE